MHWLASLSPLRVTLLALAWPMTLVLIVLAKLLSVWWAMHSDAVIAVGIERTGSSMVLPIAIVAGPSLVILCAWWFARRSVS
jgi:hypothetical protein